MLYISVFSALLSLFCFIQVRIYRAKKSGVFYMVNNYPDWDKKPVKHPQKLIEYALNIHRISGRANIYLSLGILSVMLYSTTIALLPFLNILVILGLFLWTMNSFSQPLWQEWINKAFLETAGTKRGLKPKKTELIVKLPWFGRVEKPRKLSTPKRVPIEYKWQWEWGHEYIIKYPSIFRRNQWLYYVVGVLTLTTMFYFQYFF